MRTHLENLPVPGEIKFDGCRVSRNGDTAFQVRWPNGAAFEASDVMEAIGHVITGRRRRAMRPGDANA